MRRDFTSCSIVAYILIIQVTYSLYTPSISSLSRIKLVIENVFWEDWHAAKCVTLTRNYDQ